MSFRFPPRSAVLYTLMKKALNYSISNAEDDKLLPKGRQKKKALGTAKLSVINPCEVKRYLS